MAQEKARKRWIQSLYRIWAEEGFAVVEIRIITGPLPGPGVLNAPEACTKAVEALRSLPECTFDDKLGVIGKY
jgi:hypothetical protein